jgi:hypothetical protein
MGGAHNYAYYCMAKRPTRTMRFTGKRCVVLVHDGEACEFFGFLT